MMHVSAIETRPGLGVFGLQDALARVDRVIRTQLTSELPPVDRLCRALDQYRGKMLRPALVLLTGAAVKPDETNDDLYTVAAVLEMIHLATLVHDDVLDEADTRRQAPTINRMHGNEVAVILGDFLISQSFHLCSTLDTQKTALRVGEITSTVCCGELLQLDRRGDVNVDEDTYFAIVQRKTGALIGVAAELGARHAGASDTTCARLFDAGCRLGVAFQIQDDLLDLVGDESVVGKSLGKDLEKGKVTLPLVHYLNVAGADARERMEQIIRADEPLNGVRRSICADLEASGSIAYARETAARLVAEAKDGLLTLPDTPARAALLELADTVITRRR